MSEIKPAVEQMVYIVDDDDAMRDSLVWLVESHGFVVRAFASAEAFAAAYHEEMAGCVVLDVRMPGMSGLELHEWLAARQSVLPVVFVSGHGDVPMAVSALKKGAVDFIEKPFNDRDILRLIEQCMHLDHTHHNQRQQERLVARRLSGLTEREREVLELIVAGKLNKQIADVLNISIKTVEAHRGRIMDKMGVRSVAELVQAVLTQKPK